MLRLSWCAAAAMGVLAAGEAREGFGIPKMEGRQQRGALAALDFGREFDYCCN